ncbi:unnamed protein product [Acanthoscelides obtectus]|uniref:Secreted protein n=1 Tax=Acanthoscelides obtectus TaxID=200917 RepID=A0A9P0L9Q1_ACAOB|nr:unnamed protein product [Acanthoscelides obtectus]CAK1660243.1 hypothetical protein AOBTE_LOCUS21934 [Acanthoscelides obtectus]
MVLRQWCVLVLGQLLLEALSIAKGSSGGRSSRLFGLRISRRALCGFESRPRRNFSLGHGCCDCP